MWAVASFAYNIALIMAAVNDIYTDGRYTDIAKKQDAASAITTSNIDQQSVFRPLSPSQREEKPYHLKSPIPAKHR